MDQLDNLFKGKLEGRQIPFDEAYWQAAEKLLEEQEKKRRKGFFWWWFAAGVLAGALLVVLLWPEGATQEKPVIMTIAEQASVVDPSEPQKGELVDSEKPLLPKTAVKEKNGESAASIARPPSSGDHTGGVSAVQPQDVAGPVEGLPAGSSDQAERAAMDASVVPLEGQAVVKEAEGSQVLSADRSVLAILPAIDRLAFEVEHRAVRPAGQNIQPEMPKAPAANSWQYYTLARVMLNPDDGRKVLGGAIGAGGSYNFKRSRFAYADIAYRLVSGTFGAAQQSQVQHFGFGLSQENFELTPSQLHYINTSIGIGKRWPRHQAYAGLSYQYLLGIRGRLSGSEKTAFSLDFSSAQTLEEGWLDEKGYRKHILGGVLGYQFALLDKLNIGIEVAYWPDGLSDEAVELPAASSLKENGPVFIDFGMYYQL
jgi:hypothetical protein